MDKTATCQQRAAEICFDCTKKNAGSPSPPSPSGPHWGPRVAVSKEDMAWQPKRLPAGLWFEPQRMWQGKTKDFL